MNIFHKLSTVFYAIILIPQLSYTEEIQLTPEVGLTQAKSFLNCFINNTPIDIPGCKLNFNSSIDKTVAQNILSNSFTQDNFRSILARNNFSDSASNTGSTDGDTLFLKFIGLAITKTSGIQNISSITFGGQLPFTRAFSTVATSQNAGPVVVFLPTLQEIVSDNSLKYGDSLSFKHVTYGFYVYNGSPNGSFFNAGGGGSATLVPQRCEAYITPCNDGGYRWGVNGQDIGKPVTSGSNIKLEFQGMLSDAYKCGFFFGGLFGWPTPDYKPMPPHNRTGFRDFPAPGNSGWGTNYSWRIYKKGVAVGDKIAKGDKIYLICFRDQVKPCYLGSTGGTELLTYLVAAGTTPPSFERDFIWIIDNVKEGAYKNSPANVRFGNGTDSPYWPAASVYQF